MKLSNNDYKSILNYYKINFENLSSKQIKNNAEYILATKLCKCIKKVDPTLKNESNAIALCRDSVVRKKNLKIYRFTCKKRAKLIEDSSKTKLTKTKRSLTLRNNK